MKITYRLHITCSAGHTDYRDYSTMGSAVRASKTNWSKAMGGGWYPSHIETVLNRKVQYAREVA